MKYHLIIVEKKPLVLGENGFISKKWEVQGKEAIEICMRLYFPGAG